LATGGMNHLEQHFDNDGTGHSVCAERLLHVSPSTMPWTYSLV
jgi:hypothetical protein